MPRVRYLFRVSLSPSLSLSLILVLGRGVVNEPGPFLTLRAPGRGLQGPCAHAPKVIHPADDVAGGLGLRKLSVGGGGMIYFLLAQFGGKVSNRHHVHGSSFLLIQF